MQDRLVMAAPYRLSENPDELDLDRVVGWLQQEAYWSLGRPRSTIERSFADSPACGVYSDEDGQVAVARLVTDSATFAWLCDVFVDTGHRGRGIGQELARWAVAWTERHGVDRIMLATRDAHEVYRKVGFEPLPRPEIFMQIDRRPQRLPD